MTQQTWGGGSLRPASSGSSRSAPSSGDLQYDFDSHQRLWDTTRGTPRPQGFASFYSAHQQHTYSEQAYFLGQEPAEYQRGSQATNNHFQNFYSNFPSMNAGQPQGPYGPSHDNLNGPQIFEGQECDRPDCQPHPIGYDCLACRLPSSGIPTGRRYGGEYERNNLGSDFFVPPSNHADQFRPAHYTQPATYADLHNSSPYGRPANGRTPRTPSPARTSTRTPSSRARPDYVNWDHFNNPAWIGTNGEHRFPRPDHPPRDRSLSLSPRSRQPRRRHSNDSISSSRYPARRHYATSSRRHRSRTPPSRSPSVSSRGSLSSRGSVSDRDRRSPSIHSVTSQFENYTVLDDFYFRKSPPHSVGGSL